MNETNLPNENEQTGLKPKISAFVTAMGLVTFYFWFSSKGSEKTKFLEKNFNEKAKTDLLLSRHCCNKESIRISKTNHSVHDGCVLFCMHCLCLGRQFISYRRIGATEQRSGLLPWKSSGNKKYCILLHELRRRWLSSQCSSEP